MPHLVAAPDKFRGTASAAQVARAAARGARRAGWSAAAVPLSDGGDGFLEAVGGERRVSRVVGPLGDPVDAEWRLVDDRSGGTARTAFIEMARASGLLLAGGREHNDAVAATTYGTGELIVHAAAAGATRIVVGCGGSATTDGGDGALSAIGSPEHLGGIELIAAYDVETGFLDAAALFAPQKGASAAQARQLGDRLESLAARYQTALGVDVRALPGSGAAGGLAGGLAAIGARIVSGFDLVADLVGLDRHLDVADLVMTGEGYLDPRSFEGKVVGEVIRRAAGRAPVLCIVGDASNEVGPGPFEVVRLVELAGRRRAEAEVLTLVETVVTEHLRSVQRSPAGQGG